MGTSRSAFFVARLALAGIAALTLVGLSTRFYVGAAEAVQGPWMGLLTINGSVPVECKITSTNMNFGAYDPVVVNRTDPKTATATITLTCTKSAFNTVIIGIDKGSNADAGPDAVRNMAVQSGPASYLGYFLYRNAGMTQEWGSGVTGLNVGPAPSSAPREFTIYGRIPPGSNARAGAYLDTATITVSY